MSLLHKPLRDVTAKDIESLEEVEGKNIEYKRCLPSDDYEGRIEFLADASSFANASGGHLIYGIEEENGLPVAVCGLSLDNPDAHVQKYENMLRDNIKPRIPGVQIRAVPLHDGKHALVLHIPHSWAKPHAVALRKHWRFYARNSAGKYPLDVGELRNQFLLSDAAGERIRAFRTDRLASIIAGEAPVALPETAMTVLHLVPLASSDPGFAVDFAPIEGDAVRQLLPLYASGVNHWRYNFDGLLTHLGMDNGESYLQVFRNGCIEAVETRMLQSAGQSTQVIHSIAFERELIESLARFLQILENLEVEPPLMVMLSLLGVSGYRVVPPTPPYGRFYCMENAKPIDRDSLILPDILVDHMDVDAAAVLRSAFDRIWNASGWPRSLNYNEQGEWIDPGGW